MRQATKLVTMKASSLQALGVGAKVVEVAYMLADCFGEWATPLPLRLLAQRAQGRGARGAGRRSRS